MDPVIATGLINIGGNILQKILPSNPPSVENSKSSSFESNLQDIQGSSPTSKSLETLRDEITNSPELKDFLSRNSGNEISLDKLSDGSVRVLSSTGDFMTLRPESPACANANQFLANSMSSGQNINPGRENSVMLIG
ncbi:MAG: hypothetical protein P8P90_09910 [Opitutales bacterium]|nr:hypothetical protein [Opitutales bacterium]